jgi:hypothetical protein
MQLIEILCCISFYFSIFNLGKILFTNNSQKSIQITRNLVFPARSKFCVGVSFSAHTNNQAPHLNIAHWSCVFHANWMQQNGTFFNFITQKLSIYPDLSNFTVHVIVSPELSGFTAFCLKRKLTSNFVFLLERDYWLGFLWVVWSDFVRVLFDFERELVDFDWNLLILSCFDGVLLILGCFDGILFSLKILIIFWLIFSIFEESGSFYWITINFSQFIIQSDLDIVRLKGPKKIRIKSRFALYRGQFW